MDILLSFLAGTVALAYFVMAILIVPKIKLTGATRKFEHIFRAGAIMFFVGCGFSHLHMAIHAVTTPLGDVFHQIWMHLMQAFGGWAFIWAAVRFLDITVDRRSPARAELEEQARRDPLTNAFNRRHFDAMFAYELDQRHRQDTPFCLLMIDIDNFKPINDRLGHAAGDRVLCDVADALEAVVRPTDTFARLGGDEFGVLLAGADRSTSALVAERIHQEVANVKLDHGMQLTVSIGLSSCPDDGSTKKMLLAAADADMYAKKRNAKSLAGRDLIVRPALRAGRRRAVAPPDVDRDNCPAQDFATN